MSGLFPFVSNFDSYSSSKLHFPRSFKCADSLTVHRRRLHLLPVLDQLDDDDEKAETPEKQDVIRTLPFSRSLDFLFRHYANTLVIYATDVFHSAKSSRLTY